MDTAEKPTGAIRCDACPVLCYINPGRTGACDRYANDNGQLVRIDPHVVLDRAVSRGDSVVPFLDRDREWDGSIVTGPENFVTAIGAGTTYPDYKPAPFIISSTVQGVDMVTVVTEGIFSYCGVKVKIDTDRHLGPETNLVRAQGEPVGHVTTSEYGSQMLSLGGVRHLTGGSRKEGTVTCETLLNLCDRKPVELTIDDGATVIVQAGKPPVVGGVQEERMRVGCGSATIGMFAKQWLGKVDEVVVVDDHITGVLSEHQAGKLLGVPATGIKMKGHRSTPGRYFRVAEPGTAWGGTNIDDPLSILQNFDPKIAWPKLRLLMVSTTGEHYAYFELDEALRPVEKELPAVAQRISGPHQGKLRARALHRPLHGRRGRIAAGGGHRKSRAAYPLRAGRADPRHLRRRAGLRLARRRHNFHGRCQPHARARVWLCADASAGCADRVHLEDHGLCRLGRLHGPRSLARFHHGRKRPPPGFSESRKPLAAGAGKIVAIRLEVRINEYAGANKIVGGRPPPPSERRPH